MVRSWTALALVVGLGGCLYTDRINSRPDAKIMSPVTVAYKGDVLMLVSGSTDPDGDGLMFDWQAWTVDGRVATSSSSMLMLDVRDKKDIAVTLVVTDTNGAKDDDRLDLVVQNRKPVITKLQVESQTNGMNGYTVGRLLQIRAEFADPDGDEPLTVTWMHYPTPDSVPGSMPFTVVSDTAATLRPDAIGEWIVELTVSDGEPDGTETEDLTIRVDPDLDPCLGPLSPPLASADAPVLVERDGGARVFRVASVIDDLDPYPYEVGSLDPDLGRPSFRWSIQRPGAATFEEIAGSDRAEYTLQPAAFAPGDELGLRVEVSDRTPGWPACDADTCASASPDCLQRASWRVRVR